MIQTEAQAASAQQAEHDGFAEDGAQFFQAAEEVSMFGIHLVDINHARQFQFDTVVPGPFRIHFNPGFGRNDEQDAVAGTQGGADFAAEFGIPEGDAFYMASRTPSVLMKENKVVAKMIQINYLQTTSKKNSEITQKLLDK